MNRSDCSGLSRLGRGGLRAIRQRYNRPRSRSNRAQYSASAFIELKRREPFTSRFIGQALALGALDRDGGPRVVANAARLAMVHAEIEFREVPIQVLLVHALVD